MKEKNADVWDVFLDLHDNHKLSTAYWKGAPEFQAQLTDYLKSIIDVGVSDGKTSFPYDFSYYIFHLPKDMLQNLKLHAENVLETDPNNGAAVQFLAVETFQLTERQKPLEKYPLLEKAMVLAPKDVEICHYAFSMCTWGGHEWNKTALIALERLLERLSDSSDEELYWWLSEIHSHYDVLTKPTDFYKESLRNSVLVERWEAAIRKIATVFETTLSRKPSAREALINLADIYQTLGNIEDAQAVFENRLMQDENDRNALDGLANLHEKLGNAKLAREYKVKADPSLNGWDKYCQISHLQLTLMVNRFHLRTTVEKLYYLTFGQCGAVPVSERYRTLRKYMRNITTKVLTLSASVLTKTKQSCASSLRRKNYRGGKFWTLEVSMVHSLSSMACTVFLHLSLLTEREKLSRLRQEDTS